ALNCLFDVGEFRPADQLFIALCNCKAVNAGIRKFLFYSEHQSENFSCAVIIRLIGLNASPLYITAGISSILSGRSSMQRALTLRLLIRAILKFLDAIFALATMHILLPLPIIKSA